MRRIALTGSSGLIGTALTKALEAHDWQVLRLVRRAASGPNEVRWDPGVRIPFSRKELESIGGCDAVVHLAGENVAGGLWTKERKRLIRESRVLGTGALARALAEVSGGPKLFVSASAVGYYGDRGSEVLTEASSPGSGFLAEVCVEWEKAAEEARASGIRVVHPRFGIVLAKEGGALAKMLPPFRLGLGAVLGSGEQYIGWITLADTFRALLHLIEREDGEGAYNVVAPEPVTQREFARTLAKTLRRPMWLKAPASVLRTIAGEMADGTLLASTRAVPDRLLASGFHFKDVELGAALRSVVE